MKKNLQCLFILFVAITANAQVYQPFPTDSAMWRESSFGFDTDCRDYQFTIVGDTLINDLAYHRLQQAGVEYNQDNDGYCTGNISNSINNYVGCFREDIEAKKVYFLSSTDSVEMLLYDFSLQVGDTIPNLPNDYGQQTLTVSTIDSIPLNGVYHKRFLITNCDGSIGFIPLYFIEGIGGTYGLMRFSVCPFEQFNSLKCFTANNQIIYTESPYTDDCTAITVGIEENKFENNVLLYPNPTNGTLKIEIGGYKNMATTIGIFNALGTTVKSQQIVAGVQETSIDLSDLADGIYFAIIKQGHFATTKKLVKCTL